MTHSPGRQGIDWRRTTLKSRRQEAGAASFSYLFSVVANILTNASLADQRAGRGELAHRSTQPVETWDIADRRAAVMGEPFDELAWQRLAHLGRNGHEQGSGHAQKPSLCRKKGGPDFSGTTKSPSVV